MKEVRIRDDDRLPFCLFQRNWIALAHINIFNAAWLILGLILHHTIENKDMPVSYLTNRCIASGLVQRGQRQPLILHDVIDFHCICVFELRGRSYRATRSQNEAILKQTKRRVESLIFHWWHVFVIQILIQPEQVPQYQVFDVSTHHINAAILCLAGGETGWHFGLRSNRLLNKALLFKIKQVYELWVRLQVIEGVQTLVSVRFNDLCLPLRLLLHKLRLRRLTELRPVWHETLPFFALKIVQFLDLRLVRLDHWHCVIKIDGWKVHGLEDTWLRLNVRLLLLSLTGAIVHIKKDCLRVVKARIVVASLIRYILVFFLQLFVQVFDKFDFHFLVYAFKWHGFIKCFLELFGLILDVDVLIFDLTLNSFHVRFDVIDVLDSLVRGLISDIVEDAQDLAVLLLQIFDHEMHFLVFSSEFE